jgi:plastocyanin
MLWILTVLAFSLGAILATPSVAGEIHGRITINKVLTKKRLALPDYELRGAAPAPAAPQASVDEFSRLVVYLDGPAASSEQSGSPRKLVQRSAKFTPEILVIPVGSVVSFPNEDPVFHNVFSLSKAKEFDLGYYPSGETRTVKFEKPGVVQIYCHIHRDMNAAILVVPNPKYIQPKSDGGYTLPDVPAGTQYVIVWHKSAGFFRKRVEVPAVGKVELDFSIPVPTME